MTEPTSEPMGEAVAIVVVRAGRLPLGADQAVDEAGGQAIVVGSGAEMAAGELVGARHVRWWETGPELRPGSLAACLAPVVEDVPLVIMPASPDGRDVAPRLAATLGRPLMAGAVCARYDLDHGGEQLVRTLVSRLDDRVLVEIDAAGPAVVTVAPTGRTVGASSNASTIEPLLVQDPATSAGAGPSVEAELIALVEPDLHTMDLSDAQRVLSGGAGLAVGLDDRQATDAFNLLVRVAAALGGSAGATRVVTDAGWTSYERQIGTTGVAVDPDLYIALGVSGATQHVGGLGTPRHIISVNTDGSCPMTAMADLGLVTDARALLLELAHRLGVDAPVDVLSSIETEGHRG